MILKVGLIDLSENTAKSSLRLFFIFLALFTACERQGTSPGFLPPEVKLEYLKGGKGSLRDFKGRVVLVNFWATWCPPCLAEMPSLQALQDSLGSENFVVVGIATQDERKDVEDFLKNSDIRFPIMLDYYGELSRKLGVTGYPETFLLDRDGKFLMFPDPKNGALVIKVAGERDWLKVDFKRFL